MKFETGKVLEEFPLINHSWNNIDKDLVITHLEDEEFVINLLKRKYDIQIEPLELMDFDSSLSQGQKVSIIGHDYVQNNGHELLIPASLDGEIVSKTDNGRYILKTTRPSEMVCISSFHQSILSKSDIGSLWWSSFNKEYRK